MSNLTFENNKRKESISSFRFNSLLFQKKGKTEIELKKSHSYKVPSIVYEVLQSQGQALDPKNRNFFEQRFKHDLSKVRIHQDSNSERATKAINALAYTIGENIVFGKQQYQPDNQVGRKLLAHELTHVVQQRHKSKSLDHYIDLNFIRNSSAEKEATNNSVNISKEARLSFNHNHPSQLALQEETDKKKKKAYWFQNEPPKKTFTDPLGMEHTPKGQVKIDQRTFTIDPKDPTISPFAIKFAGMDTDFTDDKAGANMDKAEKIVLNAIKTLIEDLLTLPGINYEWGGKVSKTAAKEKANKENLQNREIRARLKEPFRELSKKTLNIFIATDLTVEEKMLIVPLAISTQQVYIGPDDYGNPDRLKAAIRIPLVGLIGGEVGIAAATPALTEEQSKAAMMHELVHVMLINRRASAEQIWESVQEKLVDGPPAVKEECELLLRRYLLAQEELFVYTNVNQIYSSFNERIIRYQAFIDKIDAYFNSISVSADQTKSIKLVVNEKVMGKEVDWIMKYKYPKVITVSDKQINKLKELTKSVI